MRLIVVPALIALLPWVALAASTWQVISSDQGRRIELDRASLKRDEAGKVLVTGRVTLDRELTDVRTGRNYRIIEATTRYDCNSRNAATVRRVFKKSESEILRDEDPKSAEMPVRSGTLDDKVLREVCRPGREEVKAVADRGSMTAVADKANQAAIQLKQANEALIRAELGKSSVKAVMIKAVERPEAASSQPDGHSRVASIQDVSSASARGTRKPRPEAGGKENLHADAAMQHADIHWSYEGEGGPNNWHRLGSANVLCASGKRQSPIDIRDGIKVDIEAIRFDYKPSIFRIVDNGHTVQVSPGEGSITLTGKTYNLVQFHFHKPAEEKINGRGFDMVAHLVHKSDDGKLAVVAVLLELGSENPVVQTLWNNLPLEKNLEVVNPNATVDLNAFLPASRNYYTYMGSLTTPPCSEGVLWLVMRQPVQISAEQVEIFSRLYRNNARPVQPSWGRLIKEGR